MKNTLCNSELFAFIMEVFGICKVLFLSPMLLYWEVSGYCGVHQSLDIVVVYDESSSAGSPGFHDQRRFIVSLANALHLSPSDTNLAGVGVDNKARYGWGLRDYFTSSDIDAKLQMIAPRNGGSDMAPGWDMAWYSILSNNSRPGSERWILILTDTTYASSTSGLFAAKAAGVHVGFVAGRSASNYLKYASDPKYVIGGVHWSSINSYVNNVVPFFCPSYCEHFQFFYDFPNNMSVVTDTYSNVGYYLHKSDLAYNVHCCGAVAKLEFKAVTSGLFKFQIWRRNILLSETEISTLAGYQVYNFSPKLFVNADDVFGWYARERNPIGLAVNCTGDLCNNNIRRAINMESVSIGSSFAWGRTSALPQTAFAIKITVTNSSVPTFVQSSPIYILETLDVGSIVMDFSFTDDIGDVITYTASENSYFVYNISSGQIILGAKLPIMKSETNYTFQIDGVDSCFNKATAIINITSYGMPPSFQGLASIIEISQDNRVDPGIAFLSFNVTDIYATSIRCVIKSVIPNTRLFKLHNYQNQSAGLYFKRNLSSQNHIDKEYCLTIVCNGSSVLRTNVTVKVLSSSVEGAVESSLIELVMTVIVACLFLVISSLVVCYCTRQRKLREQVNKPQLPLTNPSEEMTSMINANGED